ncbi:MAG: hypothetical protein KY439_06490 [Actinobacteria bacterium]|nr:hypothetical protein [Actinomycetota bacterium]
MPEEFTDLEAKILSESPADTPVVLDQELDYDAQAPHHGDPHAPDEGEGPTDA